MSLPAMGTQEPNQSYVLIVTASVMGDPVAGIGVVACAPPGLADPELGRRSTTNKVCGLFTCDLRSVKFYQAWVEILRNPSLVAISAAAIRNRLSEQSSKDRGVADRICRRWVSQELNASYALTALLS